MSCHEDNDLMGEIFYDGVWKYDPYDEKLNLLPKSFLDKYNVWNFSSTTAGGSSFIEDCMVVLDGMLKELVK